MRLFKSVIKQSSRRGVRGAAVVDVKLRNDWRLWVSARIQRRSALIMNAMLAKIRSYSESEGIVAHFHTFACRYIIMSCLLFSLSFDTSCIAINITNPWIRLNARRGLGWTTTALRKQSSNLVTSEREEINIHSSISAMEKIQIKFTKSSIFFCPPIRWSKKKTEISANNFNTHTWSAQAERKRENFGLDASRKCIMNIVNAVSILNWNKIPMKLFFLSLLLAARK